MTESKKIELSGYEKDPENTMMAILMDLTSQAFGIGMMDGRLGRVNKGFEILTGYSAEELSHLDWNHTLTPPEYFDIERHYLDELVETGKPVRYEKEYIRKDGTRIPIELMVNVMKDSEGKPEYFYSFITDITERKKYDRTLHQLIRTLKAMQKSSLMMIHASDEQKFLQDVCDIIIEDCGHLMVWIGYKQYDEKKSVKPMAFAGFEADYLENLDISWEDNEMGQGPSGVSIRTGKTSICNNIKTDPAFQPWREQAIKRGFTSSIALPLFMDDVVFGAMIIYSKELDSFSDDEQLLLSKLAHDLSYGIKAIRLNNALRRSKETLEMKVKQRTSLLQLAMVDLETEKKKFQNLLNMVPAYVALITTDYNITFTNKNFIEYFGELKDQKCYEIFFGRDKTCDTCKIPKVLSSGEPYHWEAICRNNRIYQISDFSFNDNNGSPFVLEIGSDITDKRRLDELMIRKILETEEKERRRFASDLHDDLGPTLSAIKLQLSLLEKVKSTEEREKLITKCDQLLSDGIDKIRIIANNIMPNLIESYGLETSVKSFIQKIEGPANLSFRFESNLEGYRFDKESELHLYRIVAELINNTLKHAHATEVLLKFSLKENELIIEYSDNGKGYSFVEGNYMSDGSGIQNIRNRINLLHGTIEFTSERGRTLVRIIKPLSENFP
ncbi:MAG: PAS domain S-box protein [Bacteroidales bacterium]|jgi:PAS domain S-box-containing protein